MTKQLNITAIKAMAIATAYFQRDWCPDTRIDEVFDDFKNIIIQAEDNLQWAGLNEEITEEDVAEALWGMNDEEYAEWLEEMNNQDMNLIHALY